MAFKGVLALSGVWPSGSLAVGAGYSGILGLTGVFMNAPEVVEGTRFNTGMLSSLNVRRSMRRYRGRR